MNNGEIILTTSIVDMIKQRNSIMEKVTAAMCHLSEAVAMELSMTGNQYSMLDSFMTSGNHGYVRLSDPHGTLKAAMAQVDAQFWNTLMDKSGIRSFMSAQKQDAFNHLVSEGKTPPFEMDAIKTTFADLYEKRADMMEEGILDLFRRLSWDYKTNNPVMLGKKIIVNYILDNRTFKSVNQRVTNELDDLVRILCVYDAKPTPEHRHGMYNLAYAALDNDWVVHHEYFTMKIFKKGSAHIVFSDRAIPLLDQCNRVIARQFPHALPASSSKKAA